MRRAHCFSPASAPALSLSLILGLGLAGLTAQAQAQAQVLAEPVATQAAPLPAILDPQAPSLHLHPHSLPPSVSVAAEVMDWRAANAAVARFPRGHADVLCWEKAQTKPEGSAPPASSPKPAIQSPHQHGGQP